MLVLVVIYNIGERERILLLMNLEGLGVGNLCWSKWLFLIIGEREREREICAY